MTGQAHEPRRPRKRNVACARCHAQKIKCTGEKPCSKCRELGFGDKCAYVLRDRKIRINESYLEELLDENRQLRERCHGTRERNTSVNKYQGNAGIQNPLMSESAWFRRSSPRFSMYIGEATSAAFAGLLHQSLTGSGSLDSILIDQAAYTEDSVLKSLLNAAVSWPSQAQAYLLAKAALNHLDPVFHSLLAEESMEQIQGVYATNRFDDPITKCRLFALFALGEAFSSPCADTTGAPVPGTAYYAGAMECIVVLPERPSVVLVESLLLLALFCQFLNRWHSAYGLLGNALRLALSMGLNHNLPQHADTCAAKRQHRIRLWWAIYIFDRFWSLKLGLPFQVQDEDIYVGMPSGGDQAGSSETDVFFAASVHLAKIVGDITTSIYRRKQLSGMDFLQREQQILRRLKQWEQSLPSQIDLQSRAKSQARISTLHLQFYYCVIIATRPVVMYAIMSTLKSPPPRPQDNDSDLLPPAILTISKACQDAARQIHQIVVDEWTRGAVPVHGYSHPQYLFCAALVLSASCLLPFGDQTDVAAVETAIEIFRALKARGNLATTGLGECVERIHQCVLSRKHRTSPPPLRPAAPPLTSCPEENGVSSLAPQISAASSSSFLDLAAEIPLSEPDVLDDFLALSGVGIGEFDFGSPFLDSHFPSMS